MRSHHPAYGLTMDCLTVPASRPVSQAMPANQRGLLCAKLAAEYLSVSPATFSRIVAAADCIIKPHRLGTNVRYKVSQLDAYIESLIVAPGDFGRVRSER